MARLLHHGSAAQTGQPHCQPVLLEAQLAADAQVRDSLLAHHAVERRPTDSEAPLNLLGVEELREAGAHDRVKVGTGGRVVIAPKAAE